MVLSDPAPGGFCEQAWQREHALVEAIERHPFNRELEAGTLSGERFAFYLVQDTRYLAAFSRALAAAATRAADPGDAAFLAGSARTALVVEAELHAGYLAKLAVDAGAVATSPSCLAYASYLQAVALAEPYPVLVASLLPCFWVYQHVGAGVLARTAGVSGHPYEQWIATYGAEDFAESVDAMRVVADRAWVAATAAVRLSMLSAFHQATLYEWMFWQSAWEMETWPAPS